MAPRLIMVVGCAFSVLACGGAPVDPRETGTATRPEAQPQAPIGNYEVHEWGLVRQEAGSDTLRIGGVAPPIQEVPMIVLKPVLYFHAKEPMTLSSVTVTAPTGGAILEVWPLLRNGRAGDRIGSRVEWSNVLIDPDGPCEVSPLPGVADPPCTALGGDFCEVASLATARIDETSCVTANGTTDRFLFYRGRSTTLRPPLLVGRSAEGRITFTNAGSAKIPGKVIRIQTTDDDSSATVFSPPEPGQSIDAAPASFASAPRGPAEAGAMAMELPIAVDSASVDSARRAIGESMGNLGLSNEEIAAFMRAWDRTLFPQQRRNIQLDLAEVAPTDTILYFLPEETTDNVAKLEFAPKPRVVRRAIAVWTALPR